MSDKLEIILIKLLKANIYGYYHREIFALVNLFIRSYSPSRLMIIKNEFFFLSFATLLRDKSHRKPMMFPGQ